MMNRLVVICLLLGNLLLGVIAYSSYISPVRRTDECRSDEVYFSCGNACEITCANVTSSNRLSLPDIQLEIPCRYNCVSGCFCRPPLLRNRLAQCVNEKNCHRQHNRGSLIQELNQLFSDDRDTETRRRPRPTSPSGQSDAFFDTFVDGFSIDRDIDSQFDSFFGSKSSSEESGGKISTKSYSGESIDSNRPITSKSEPVNQLEAFVEQETDRIINQIHRGLKIKSFVKRVLRELIQESKYSPEQINDANKNGRIVAGR